MLRQHSDDPIDDADAANDELAMMDALRKGIQIYTLPLVYLASGRMTLKDKFMSIAHAFFWWPEPHLCPGMAEVLWQLPLTLAWSSDCPQSSLSP